MTLVIIAICLLTLLYVHLLVRIVNVEHTLGDFAEFIIDIDEMMEESADKLKEIKERLEQVFAKKVKKITKKFAKLSEH